VENPRLGPPDEESIAPRLSSGTTANGPSTGRRPFLRVSKRRFALALAIAAISDAGGAFVTLAPPFAWALDALTAVLLFAVLGWQWLLLPGLVLEAIPGVGVLPFWLLVVGAIGVWGTARPKLWIRPGRKTGRDDRT
jgi:hypothetical protein